MTKHKHADMIKAKADNMELVVFTKYNHEDSFRVSHFEKLVRSDGVHFLCLPQHNENGQCLHWLNGGIIQDNFEGEWSDIKVHSGDPDWNEPDQIFMNEEFDLRIKPRKEKRWIGVHPLGTTAPLGKTKKFVSDIVLHQLVDAVKPFCEWQFIEIEIEVTK